MKNFRPIRTAVTIGLIVTMMIQPMVFVAAAPLAGRSDTPERTETNACEGCGCCEIQSPDQRCCCCSGDADSSNEASSELQPDTSVVDEQPSESLLGVCLCGITVPPLDRGARSPERIIVRPVAISTAVSADVIHSRAKSLALRTDSRLDRTSTPRYSQRFLCMWLI